MFINECGDGVYIPPSEEPQEPKVTVTSTEEGLHQLEVIRTRVENSVNYEVNLKDLAIEKVENEEGAYYSVKYNGEEFGQINPNNRTVDGLTSGAYSEASGYQNNASGEYSAAIGGNNNAVEGKGAVALGGEGLKTTHKTLVTGEYNKDEDMAFIIGNGTSDSERSNCFSVSHNGDINGLSLKLGNTSLSETQLQEILKGGGDLTPVYYPIYTAVDATYFDGVAYSIGPVLFVEADMSLSSNVANYATILNGMPSFKYNGIFPIGSDSGFNGYQVGIENGHTDIYNISGQAIPSGERIYISFATLIETPDTPALGLRINFETSTFTRVGTAANLSAGSDFDKFAMYGGRMKCNVADDGTINAFYGDDTYTEDGTNGQVMIYQPKFYYLIIPYETDPISGGADGYHLRDVVYYVSDTKLSGFTLHPAFYDASGNEVDYILTSAYEGCLYDTSASTYIGDDSQVMDASADKLSSIADVKPASGITQALTRPNVEQISQNRGTNWHCETIKSLAAEQLLMMIEYGTMNMQDAIGMGVVNIPATGTYNYASQTGSTSSFGNGSGRAEGTDNRTGDTATTYTDADKTAVCWRGKENMWGNINTFVEGVNVYGSSQGGRPWICGGLTFVENKTTSYNDSGFILPNDSGYISSIALGVGSIYEPYLFPSETSGNSALPVGDYATVVSNLSGYAITKYGGAWDDDDKAGAFCVTINKTTNAKNIGGRLVFIPTKGSDTYNAAITYWKSKWGGEPQ